MRTNAIVRIVIYSLVVLLLLGVLAAGLGIGMLSFDLELGHGSYTTGSGSVPAADIRKLEIEWAAGSIEIVPGDSDSITFSEVLPADAKEMVFEQRGNTLTIRYSAPAIEVGIVNNAAKDLTVTVPADWFCQELRIDAAAVDVHVSSLTAESVDLNSASGDCSFTGCDFGELDVDAAAGMIAFRGKLGALDCDVAAADVEALFTVAPRRIDVDSSSGELDITLPADCGFRVDVEGLSADFTTDFDTTRENGCYVYGDQSCQIEVDSFSADVTIRKGE